MGEELEVLDHNSALLLNWSAWGVLCCLIAVCAGHMSRAAGQPYVHVTIL